MSTDDAIRRFHGTCIASVMALAATLSACSGADSQSGTGTALTGAGGGVLGTGGGTALPNGAAGSIPGSAGTTGLPMGTAGTVGLPMGTAGMVGLPMGTAGMVGLPMGMGGTGTAGMGVAGTGIAGMLGMGGASGGGGTINAGGAAGAAGAGGMRADLGVGTGTDVVLLGDSWMSNTLQIEGTGGGLAPSLIAAAKKPYRNYAVQGVMMLMADTFGPAIPTQWDQAKAANPDVKTVVMTGGGNDIIQNATIQADCTAGGDMCKMLLMQISDALNTLWTKLADSNVQDVVYIQYASDVGSTPASVRMTQKTPDICLTGRIRCHAVDSTMAVMHQIAADGIHPLQAANDRLAQVVYSLMTSEGMRR